jgi:uncharacterized Zn finger protein
VHLFSLKAFDELISLGSFLINAGINHTYNSDDEGHTLNELTRAMEITYKALPFCSLLKHKKLLWVINLNLKDQWNITAELLHLIETIGDLGDWGRAADILMKRLKKEPNQNVSSAEYDREALLRWISKAFTKADRKEELLKQKIMVIFMKLSGTFWPKVKPAKLLYG